MYSDALVARKGKLARVWVAAHMERKLSKAQLLHTDIDSAVSTIRLSSQQTLALRVSGQLLLGVTVIYSRKTKYLLDDCSDTATKIKLASRPSIADVGSDVRQVANIAAITLATDLNNNNINNNVNNINNNIQQVQGNSSEFDTLAPEQAVTLESLLNLVGAGSNINAPLGSGAKTGLLASAIAFNSNVDSAGGPMRHKRRGSRDIFSFDLEELSQSSADILAAQPNGPHSPGGSLIAPAAEPGFNTSLSDIEVGRDGKMGSLLSDTESENSITMHRGNLMKRKRTASDLVAASGAGINTRNNINTAFDNNGFGEWNLDLGAGIVDMPSVEIEVGRDAGVNATRLSASNSAIDLAGFNAIGGVDPKQARAALDDNQSEHSSLLESDGHSKNGEVSLEEFLPDFGMDDGFFDGQNFDNVNNNDDNNNNAGRATKRRRRRHVLFDKEIEIPIRRMQAANNNRDDILVNNVVEYDVATTRSCVSELLSIGLDLNELPNLGGNSSGSGLHFHALSNVENTRNDSYLVRHMLSRAFTLDMPKEVSKVILKTKASTRFGLMGSSQVENDLESNAGSNAVLGGRKGENSFAIPEIGSINGGNEQDQNDGFDFLNNDFDMMGPPPPENEGQQDFISTFDHAKEAKILAMNEARLEQEANIDRDEESERTFNLIESAPAGKITFDELPETKTSRPIAARTFFDVLRLATAGKIKVNQETPCGSIAVSLFA